MCSKSTRFSLLMFIILTFHIIGSTTTSSLFQKNNIFYKLLPKAIHDEKESPRIVPNPGRIIGGKMAQEGEFPFVVSLQNYKTKRHFCGGVLLSATLILTACHCVTLRGLALKPRLRDPSQIDAVAGAIDLYHLPKFAQRRNGVALHRHPDCARLPTGLIYDVGVVEVTPFTVHPSLEASDFVEILTPEAFTGFNEMSSITRTTETRHFLPCKALGWGATREKGPVSPKLMEVDLNLLSQEDCYGKLNPYAQSISSALTFSKDSQFCTLGGNGSKDACAGDSGGPLLCEVPGAPHRMMVGAASWGIGCARHQVPGIWARMDVAERWLLEVLEISRAPFSRKNCWSILLSLINLLPN